jgi:hypothetical protein
MKNNNNINNNINNNEINIIDIKYNINNNNLISIMSGSMYDL